jgi:hypothetical protein
MTLQNYEPIYIKDFVYDYYEKHKSKDGWCYQTYWRDIADTPEKRCDLMNSSVLYEFLYITDFDKNILESEIKKFTNAHFNTFAWRIMPIYYRLKGTNFNTPDYMEYMESKNDTE